MCSRASILLDFANLQAELLMIHHVSVGTTDIKRSRAFYDPVLKVLGLRLLSADKESADYGTATVLFSVETPVNGRAASAGNGVHVAFHADHRKTVCEFHQIGLVNGGTDSGTPALRPEYDGNYFGAFLLDPDGNKIEAVTFSAD
jgi:catechol 2,3-dioxygenase-like lactoylglutathione lyase family enzyme